MPCCHTCAHVPSTLLLVSYTCVCTVPGCVFVCLSQPMATTRWQRATIAERLAHHARRSQRHSSSSHAPRRSPAHAQQQGPARARCRSSSSSRSRRRSGRRSSRPRRRRSRRHHLPLRRLHPQVGLFLLWGQHGFVGALPGQEGQRTRVDSVRGWGAAPVRSFACCFNTMATGPAVGASSVSKGTTPSPPNV